MTGLDSNPQLLPRETCALTTPITLPHIEQKPFIFSLYTDHVSSVARSVGCTVVEMLTQKPPFSDYESFAAMFQIVTCKHPKYELPSGASVYVKDFLVQTFKSTGQDRPSAEGLLDHRFVKDLT